LKVKERNGSYKNPNRASRDENYSVSDKNTLNGIESRLDIIQEKFNEKIEDREIETRQN